MASIPREKIVKVVKEKKMSTAMRGFKQGMLKKAVDEVTGRVVGPLAEKAIPKLHAIHPRFKLADGAVHGLLEFATLMAIAEILEVAGPLVAKIPGTNMSPEDAAAKLSAIALWIRNHAGEKLGENAVEAAMELIPIMKEMLSETDAVGELLNAFQSEESESKEAEVPVPAELGVE